MKISDRRLSLLIAVSVFCIGTVAALLFSGGNATVSFSIGLSLLIISHLTAAAYLEDRQRGFLEKLLQSRFIGNDLYSVEARIKLDDMTADLESLVDGTIQFADPNKCQTIYPDFIDYAKGRSDLLLALHASDPSRFWTARGSRAWQKNIEYAIAGGVIKRLFVLSPPTPDDPAAAARAGALTKEANRQVQEWESAVAVLRQRAPLAEVRGKIQVGLVELPAKNANLTIDFIAARQLDLAMECILDSEIAWRHKLHQNSGEVDRVLKKFTELQKFDVNWLN